MKLIVHSLYVIHVFLSLVEKVGEEKRWGGRVSNCPYAGRTQVGEEQNVVEENVYINTC